LLIVALELTSPWVCAPTGVCSRGGSTIFTPPRA
jgi:hypothetical protein